MTDTNSTTNAAASTADEPRAENQISTSGATAPPSNSENADTKADAVAADHAAAAAFAAQSAPTVAQEVFDRLHADYQAVLLTLEQMKAQRDAALKSAKSLSEQIASQAQAFEAKLKAVAPEAQTLYADANEEITALKTRVHDLLAGATAAANRLGDLVPVSHPGRNVASLLQRMINQVREHI